METRSFHKSVTTNGFIAEAFNKITKVGDWWLTSFKGRAEKPGDQFRLIMGDHGNATFKIAEVIPCKKIVWLVTDCYLSNYEDKAEWKGTRIIFELSDLKGKAKIDFTHEGLTSEMECYSDCEPKNGIGSLVPETQTVRLGVSLRFGSSKIMGIRERKTGLESETQRIKIQ
jgi:hypothetical protein